MNDLQQLALIATKGWEDKELFEAEWRMFKYMSVAAHPEHSESILEALGDPLRAQEEEVDQWAQPIGDEIPGDYEPYSNYSDEIIAELRSQGFAVRDVPD